MLGCWDDGKGWRIMAREKHKMKTEEQIKQEVIEKIKTVF